MNGKTPGTTQSGTIARVLSVPSIVRPVVNLHVAYVFASNVIWSACWWGCSYLYILMLLINDNWTQCGIPTDTAENSLCEIFWDGSKVNLHILASQHLVNRGDEDWYKKNRREECQEAVHSLRHLMVAVTVVSLSNCTVGSILKVLQRIACPFAIAQAQDRSKIMMFPS